MRTFRQKKCSRYGALLITAVMFAGAGWATAADHPANPPQNQNQNQSSVQTGQTRDLPLEQQIAHALRRQGFGAQGEIMILATGDKVTLLGTVPSASQKKAVEEVVKPVAQGKSIDDRLHVSAQTAQLTDAQLQSKVYDELGKKLAQEVQVWVQNGAATLRGNVKDWHQVAEAINAAFAAGASQVNSQFSVAEAAGTYPPYGYVPGPASEAGGPQAGARPSQSQGHAAQGSQNASAQYGTAPPAQRESTQARAEASLSDLSIAHQVAQNLWQHLTGFQNIQIMTPGTIYIQVSNGTVTLGGSVLDDSIKQQAQGLAQSVSGVQNVQNSLDIAPVGSYPAFGYFPAGTYGNPQSGYE